MSARSIPESLRRYAIHMVGIKGTGMSALAEILVRLGALVTGSDTEEKFYTDEILQAIGVHYREGFRAENVPQSARLVVYSTAYSPNENVELLRAAELGIPAMSYNEVLGELSRRMPSAGVSGVHGKTTTTAMAGMIIRELGLPGVVLAGSAVEGFGGKSTLYQGESFFVAETCEYRRNFLLFSPRHIVLTSVEQDHLDYFRDLQDISAAFTEYAQRLPQGGTLIYCADDAGASDVAGRIKSARPDIVCVPYGITAAGPYCIESIRELPGEITFSVCAFDGNFSLHVPGRHNVLNATAAAALVQYLVSDRATGLSEPPGFAAGVSRALAAFRGSRRRSEIVGQYDGILVLDDYAHHPTAIEKTLEGIAAFYPNRRIIVDFMSHTYSRTAALLDEFAHAFSHADRVITHRIYASARERTGTVTGRDLAEAIQRHHHNVSYYEQVMDALSDVVRELRPGDIFITMGAGDNWKLGRAVLSTLGAQRTGVAG